MTFFIFAGDMLVMLFMTGLIIWLGTTASRETTKFTAEIPLHDEQLEPKH